MSEIWKFYWMIGESPISWEAIDSEELPNPRNTYWDNKFEYNQDKEWYKSWCVFFAWANNVASNYWDDSWINWDKIAELMEEKYWRAEWQGMYVSKWWNWIVEYFNSINPEDPIEMRRINILDEKEKFLNALNIWYMLHWWYWGSKAYNSDMLDDCILDWEDYWDPSYYHSINITKKNNWKVVVDNYKWRDCNIYKIEDFFERVREWTYFSNVNIYIFKNDKMTQLEQDIQDVEKAYELWITNDKQNVEDVKAEKYTPDVKTILFVMRADRKL